MEANSRATHQSRKTGKDYIAERYNDEKGFCIVVRTMTGKAIRVYRKKEMNVFNEKYISLAMKKKESRVRRR